MTNNVATVLIIESERENALEYFTDLEIAKSFVNDSLDGFIMLMTPDGYEVNVYTLDGFIQDFNSDERRISSEGNYLKRLVFKQEITIIT